MSVYDNFIVLYISPTSNNSYKYQKTNNTTKLFSIKNVDYFKSKINKNISFFNSNSLSYSNFFSIFSKSKLSNKQLEYFGNLENNESQSYKPGNQLLFSKKNFKSCFFFNRKYRTFFNNKSRTGSKVGSSEYFNNREVDFDNFFVNFKNYYYNTYLNLTGSSAFSVGGYISGKYGVKKKEIYIKSSENNSDLFILNKKNSISSLFLSYCSFMDKAYKGLSLKLPKTFWKFGFWAIIDDCTSILYSFKLKILKKKLKINFKNFEKTSFGCFSFDFFLYRKAVLSLIWFNPIIISPFFLKNFSDFSDIYNFYLLERQVFKLFNFYEKDYGYEPFNDYIFDLVRFLIFVNKSTTLFLNYIHYLFFYLKFYTTIPVYFINYWFFWFISILDLSIYTVIFNGGPVNTNLFFNWISLSNFYYPQDVVFFFLKIFQLLKKQEACQVTTIWTTVTYKFIKNLSMTTIRYRLLFRTFFLFYNL